MEKWRFNGDGQADFVDYSLFINEVDKDGDSHTDNPFVNKPDPNPFISNGTSNQTPSSKDPSHPLQIKKYDRDFERRIREEELQAKRQELENAIAEEEARTKYYADNFQVIGAHKIVDHHLLFIIGLNVCFEGLIGYQGFDVPLLFSEDVCLLLIL